MSKQVHNYQLKKMKMRTEDGFIERWIVTDNSIPFYEINDWLMDIGKTSTNKTYGNAIIRFLKYLDQVEVHYKDASLKTIRKYVNHLLYNSADNTTSIVPILSDATINNYLTVVSEFYRWMADELQVNLPLFSSKSASSRGSGIRLKKSFMYGQVYTFKEGYSFNMKRTNRKIKPRKEYIKWYSTEEIEAIADNFNTLRDRIIFLISVEVGYRIDEILTMKYEDFDRFTGKIRCSKSKTMERAHIIPQYLWDDMERYLITDRQEIENKKGICEHLFINLRKGPNQGKPVSYRNYWDILRRTAKRAGLDAEKIRTHSGRSTKVQQLIEKQILHPEKNITDLFIKEYFGWTSIDSLSPYKKKEQSPVILNAIAEKVVPRIGSR